MTENFLKTLQKLQSQEFNDIPSFNNKKNVKAVKQKYSKLFNLLEGQKNQKSNYLEIILMDRVEQLKRNTQDFQNAYSNFKKRKNEIIQLQSEGEGVQKDHEKTKTLRDNFEKKKKEMCENCQTTFETDNKKRQDYINELEKKFKDREDYVLDLLNRKSCLKEQKKFLDEQSGKVLKDIEDNEKKMQDTYKEESEKVENMDNIFNKQILTYKEECGKKDQYIKDKEEAKKFYEDHHQEFETIDSTIKKHELKIDEKFKELKRALKKVEKIKKRNSGNITIKNFEKMEKLNDKLDDLLKTHFNANKVVNSCLSKQQIFMKMIGDFNQKLVGN